MVVVVRCSYLVTYCKWSLRNNWNLHSIPFISFSYTSLFWRSSSSCVSSREFEMSRTQNLEIGFPQSTMICTAVSEKARGYILFCLVFTMIFLRILSPSYILLAFWIIWILHFSCNILDTHFTYIKLAINLNINKKILIKLETLFVCQKIIIIFFFIFVVNFIRKLGIFKISGGSPIHQIFLFFIYRCSLSIWLKWFESHRCSHYTRKLVSLFAFSLSAINSCNSIWILSSCIVIISAIKGGLYRPTSKHFAITYPGILTLNQGMITPLESSNEARGGIFQIWGYSRAFNWHYLSSKPTDDNSLVVSNSLTGVNIKKKNVF